MSGMQKRAIDAHLRQRIQRWVWSIKNPQVIAGLMKVELPEAPTTNNLVTVSTEDDVAKQVVSAFQQKVLDAVIVSGGAIASMLLGESPNDIDVYFTNREVARLVAQYYLLDMASKDQETTQKTDKVSRIDVVDNLTSGVSVFIKSAGMVGDGIETKQYEYFEMMSVNAIDDYMKEHLKRSKDNEGKHVVKFITSNAITLHSGIQIILRFCGSAGEIHRNYDFVHATNWWTAAGGVVYNPDALQALLEKRLVYVGSLFPLASLFRIRKFLARGFRISAGEITKIAYDVSKLSLDDPHVLHDQLIGVDYAYFSEVIQILNGNSERAIDRTYLFNIIDQVFNDEEAHTDPVEVPVEEVTANDH